MKRLLDVIGQAIFFLKSPGSLVGAGKPDSSQTEGMGHQAHMVPGCGAVIDHVVGHQFVVSDGFIDSRIIADNDQDALIHGCGDVAPDHLGLVRIFNDNEDRENLIERLSIKGASEKSTSKETKGRSEAESGVR